MKKLFSLLMLIPVLMWAQDPPAPKKQYVGVNVGTDYCFLTNKSNSGLKVGIKAGMTYGYYFDSGFRGELEVSYRKNSFRTKYNSKKDDALVSKEYNGMHSWAYLGNMFYDLNQLTYQQIVPYVGIGVGYGQFTDKIKYKSDSKVNVEKQRDDRFVYQGIAGARYAINENVFAALEYKYFCGKAHAKDHSIALSLIRNF
jgi:opacity protein-like surface antigen